MQFTQVQQSFDSCILLCVYGQIWLLMFIYFNFDRLDRNKDGFQDFNKSNKFLGSEDLAFFDRFGIRVLGIKGGEVLEFKDSISS